MPEDGRRALYWLAAFALFITAVRSFLAVEVGLAPDEAYYWQWSRALSLSYPDHPPLVAWLIRLGTEIAGETPLGVRLFGIIGGLAAIGVTYRIGREIGLDMKRSVAAAALQSLLAAPMAAALIITPDTPLGLAWLTAELAMIRIHKGDTKWWYVLGASMGIAMLSKYSGLMLMPFVVFSFWKSLRGRCFHLVAALAIALSMVLPHLISEWYGGFSAARFQRAHLAGDLPMSGVLMGAPQRLLEVISGQMGLLTPIVAVWVGIGVWRARTDTSRVLSIGLLLPLGATLAAAVFTHPEQNWAALGHPGAAVLCVMVLDGRQRTTRCGYKWRRGAAFGSAAVCAVLIHLHLLLPILPLPPTKDPTARLFGWERLAVLSPLLNGVDAVVCDNYGLAAMVAWHFRGRTGMPSVHNADRSLFPTAGRLLILNQQNDFGLVQAPLMCASMDEKDDIPLRRRDGEAWDSVAVAVGGDCRRRFLHE